MQYALVNASDEVVNVIELDPGASFTPPEGLTLVQGRHFPTAVPSNATTQSPSFLARDFFAQLTVADYSAIKTSVTTNDTLGLLWSSLQAQGDAPVRTDSVRFLAGWSGLKQALPAARAQAIADELGIPA